MANERARWLRRNRTSAELRLWWHLRGLKARGHKFRQQAPIDHFIVDFVCLSARLVIEVDGATHSTDEEKVRDAVRERYLVEQGLRVLRLRNADVYDNLDGVMETILRVSETPTRS